MWVWQGVVKVWGGSNGGITERYNTVLSERQINILGEMGLPTNYEELSLSQKSAIESIESLLDYLEEKYNESFAYVEYVSANFSDDEHLIAYPESGSRHDEVTVYRIYENGKFYYKDNYTEVKANGVLEEVVERFVYETSGIRSAKIFCEVLSVDGQVNIEDVLKNVVCSIYIFIDEEYCSLDECNNFLVSCKDLLEESSNGYPISIWVLRTTGENLKIITDDNYENMLSEDIYSLKHEYALSGSGKINLY